ncbi:hypothetical protein b3_0156 [Synechococcus phage B3]|nr:hypothetical protein b3_0156 [Synechococcus phage B3]QGT54770.1 hypothetical protein b23_0155 [Synechococcus phage B23]
MNNHYKEAKVIMRNYSPLWFSITFLIKKIKFETIDEYLEFEYQMINSPELICKQGSNRRTVFALRDRYQKETAWYIRVLSILMNKII